MVTTDTTPEVALEPKTKLTGKILKTTLAGALVDVGQPVPGVLHISQLQENPVNKVEEVLKEGQAVDVWVKHVRKDRIELTMIQPLMYDWKDLQDEMIVKGKVVRLEPYGVFVDIGAERPGMIHISELARGYVKNCQRCRQRRRRSGSEGSHGGSQEAANPFEHESHSARNRRGRKA